MSAATCSRQATSRAQARHTDCRAVSSASVPAEAASARTAPASPATGVAGVAGSSGQPVPGGTRAGHGRRAGRCRDSDQAMPSRMSCSLATTSVKPKLLHYPVEHQRPAADHVHPARVHHADTRPLGRLIRSNSAVTALTVPAGIRA